MEVPFQNFTNNSEIKSTDINFNFFELNTIYMETTMELFTSFMNYMLKQITKYNLKLDIDDFVMDCYSATDTGLFYNPYFFDRYQEPEEYNQSETQYYGSME